ncbi:hypothetical protein Lser_V15G45844 [Lactuca serriola]
MAYLKAAEMHNLAIVLDDPPVDHRDFMSMMYRLRECCLAHAITVNLVIYENLIQEFWRSAKVTEMNKELIIEAVVQNCKIRISEQYIRDTLLIIDEPDYPTEDEAEEIPRIIDRMGYEGSYPPTVKKLLPPYWCFLAHVFISCMSGRRSGSDEISIRNTGVIVSLAAGNNFNFSKYVLDEFLVNIGAMTRGNRDTFLMYPRFIQVFIDDQFPDMVKDGDKMDTKSLGPHTVGVIKQNRKGKVVFQGLHPLVKFGQFAEINESSESHGTSEKTLSELTSSERVSSKFIITVSDHEDNETPDPKAQVDGFEDVDLTGFDKDDIQMNFGSNDDFLTEVNLDNLLDNVNEVVHVTTETREEEDVFVVAPPVSNPEAEIATPMVTISGIPSLDTVLPTSMPMEDDLTATQATPPPNKRHRLVLRLATQSTTTESATAPPTITPAIVSAEPINDGPSSVFQTGGSLFQLESSPPRPDHDDASAKIVRLLAEEQFSTPPSHGKGIFIGGDDSREDNPCDIPIFMARKDRFCLCFVKIKVLLFIKMLRNLFPEKHDKYVIKTFSKKRILFILKRLGCHR